MEKIRKHSRAAVFFDGTSRTDEVEVASLYKMYAQFVANIVTPHSAGFHVGQTGECLHYRGALLDVFYGKQTETDDFAAGIDKLPDALERVSLQVCHGRQDEYIVAGSLGLKLASGDVGRREGFRIQGVELALHLTKGLDEIRPIRRETPGKLGLILIVTDIFPSEARTAEVRPKARYRIEKGQIGSSSSLAEGV